MIRKRLLYIVLIILVGLCLKLDVFASTVTWEQITNEFKASFDDRVSSIISIIADDTNLKYATTATKYEINFTYENDIIRLVVRDSTGMTEKERLDNAFGDDVIINTLLNVISKLYTVDINLIDQSAYSDYGIIINGNEIVYNNANDNTFGNALEITEFSINLNRFETATASLVGTYKENTTTSTTTTTATITNQQSDNSKNPKTGVSTPVFAIVSIIGLSIIGFFASKKNDLFKEV